MRRDLVHAVRIICKNPVFAATAILTLVLAIGGDPLFSVVQAVLLKPLAACFIAAALTPTACALASEPKTFDRTLAVSGRVTLDILSGPGGINITSDSALSVVVYAVIRSVFGRADLGVAEGNILARQQNPPIEQNGNAIRIAYVKNEGMLKGVTVSYDNQTPRRTQVHAFADAGGIRSKRRWLPARRSDGEGKDFRAGDRGICKNKRALKHPQGSDWRGWSTG